MRKKLFFITLSVIVINIALDRITKMLAVTYIKNKPPVSYFFGTFKMIYVENTGAFLSLGSDWLIGIKYAVFIVIPLLFCLYGIYYCIFKSGKTVIAILISAIIGGGLGNVIDRIIYDFHVIDFMNFGIKNLRTGVLNVADLSVTFGAVILFIYISFEERAQKKRVLEAQEEVAKRESEANIE